MSHRQRYISYVQIFLCTTIIDIIHDGLTSSELLFQINEENLYKIQTETSRILDILFIPGRIFVQRKGEKFRVMPSTT